MKMIAKYASQSEAEERAAFLRSRGIATHVTSLVSLRYNVAHQGLYRAALWVMLEPQYRDALSLLENPDSPIDSDLSPEQMQHLETEGRQRAEAQLLRYAMIIAGVLVTGLVVAGGIYLLWT